MLYRRRCRGAHTVPRRARPRWRPNGTFWDAAKRFGPVTAC